MIFRIDSRSFLLRAVINCSTSILVLFCLQQTKKTKRTKVARKSRKKESGRIVISLAHHSTTSSTQHLPRTHSLKTSFLLLDLFFKPRFELPSPRKSLLQLPSRMSAKDNNNKLLLWVDKWRPTTLDKLDLHKELSARLKKMVISYNSYFGFISKIPPVLNRFLITLP